MSDETREGYTLLNRISKILSYPITSDANYYFYYNITYEFII